MTVDTEAAMEFIEETDRDYVMAKHIRRNTHMNAQESGMALERLSRKGVVEIWSESDNGHTWRVL